MLTFVVDVVVTIGIDTINSDKECHSDGDDVTSDAPETSPETDFHSKTSDVRKIKGRSGPSHSDTGLKILVI